MGSLFFCSLVIMIKNRHNRHGSQKNFLSLAANDEKLTIMNYKDFPFYRRTNLERLFNDAYEVYRALFGWLFFFSFLFLVLTQTLSGYLLGDNMSSLDQFMQDPTDLNAALQFYKGLLPLFFIQLFLNSFLYVFLGYFIIARYLEPERGLGGIAVRSLTKYYIRFLFVTFLAYLILTFGTLIGFLALIIGSLVALAFLGTSLSVALPVLLVEDTGIFQTIGRSFRLVLKDFWSVFGYLLIFGLIYILMGMIFNALSMAPYASSFLRELFHPAAQDAAASLGTFQMMTKPLYVILNAFFSALLLPLVPLFSILIYFHLKYIEDEKNEEIETVEVI